MSQLRIPAVYMRGGTSKGVFFLADDLPSDSVERERLLLRVVGSPDRYGRHIDGMGGATSSTSKVVIVSRSQRPDCDVDYLFGAVSIEEPLIDWSGNCGNLTSAVGPFAICSGLVAAPENGTARVRIWQANVGRRIVAHVPVQNGEIVEEGDFEFAGLPFPSAEIRLDFLDPGGDGSMFPTGAVLDRLDVPGVGVVDATLINAGNPTIFVDAGTLGLRGTELQQDVNGDAELLARAEALRAHGAVAMGLGATAEEISRRRPHTPKVVLVASASGYTTSDGRPVRESDIDLLARIFSMGQLHHAMTGTGAVAIAAAAAVPGTLVHRLHPSGAEGVARFGHPSGVFRVGAETVHADGEWTVTRVTMSRSARRLMEGWVRVPAMAGSR
jgi:probable AcnD-accessory protein PrpF